jgi:hypothetical protein
MKKWLNEPLVHFLVIGALLFGLYSLLNPQEMGVSDNRIVISAGDIERLSANWSKKWNRPPTAAELRGLVDAYIREEVYYREAIALGLDRNDTILRRRMMQKMEFLSNDLADLSIPDETALEQYFLANQQKYEQPARISFSHIYFSFDRRGDRILDDAKKVLTDARASTTSGSRLLEQGDPFMHQYDFTSESSFEITRLFGQGFAEQIFQLEAGDWQGPVQSGYGLHLIRVNEKVAAQVPELATVIDKVRTDLMFEQRQTANDEIYKRFRERYEIVVEEVPDRSVAESSAAVGGKSS